MKAIQYHIIVTILFIFMSCNNGSVQEKARPENVPNEAQWYGGKDGGVWVKVDSTDKKNHFYLEVYNEYKGRLWTKGEFMLNPECNSKNLTVSVIKESISSWTGKTILLDTLGEDGKYCELLPMQK